MEGPRLLDALAAAVGDLDDVLVELEHLAQGVGGIVVVLDDEHAAGCGSRRRGRAVPPAWPEQPRRSSGRVIVNVAPLPRPAARCAHRAAVHLDEPLDEREPEPEPALAAVEGGVRLREGLEEPRQHLGLDPAPRVSHGEDGSPSSRSPTRTETVVFPPCGVNLAAFWRRLPIDLGEAHSITVDPDLGRGRKHLQPDVALRRRPCGGPRRCAARARSDRDARAGAGSCRARCA